MLYSSIEDHQQAVETLEAAAHAGHILAMDASDLLLKEYRALQGQYGRAQRVLQRASREENRRSNSACSTLSDVFALVMAHTQANITTTAASAAQALGTHVLKAANSPEQVARCKAGLAEMLAAEATGLVKSKASPGEIAVKYAGAREAFVAALAVCRKAWTPVDPQVLRLSLGYGSLVRVVGDDMDGAAKVLLDAHSCSRSYKRAQEDVQVAELLTEITNKIIIWGGEPAR